MAATLAVLVFMVYFDLVAYGASNFLRPWYYDMIEHFIGGGIIGGFFLYYARSFSGQNFPKNFFLTVLAAISFVVIVALIWEVYEYYVNLFAGLAQDPISDTLSDLVLGTLGAAVSASLIRRKFIER